MAGYPRDVCEEVFDSNGYAVRLGEQLQQSGRDVRFRPLRMAIEGCDAAAFGAFGGMADHSESDVARRTGTEVRTSPWSTRPWVPGPSASGNGSG